MADGHAFYDVGTTTPHRLRQGSSSFDVANTGTSYLEIAFVREASVSVSPRRAHIAPGGRQTFTLSTTASSLRYYPSYYTTADTGAGLTCPGFSRGRTTAIVPVGSTLFTSMRSRLSSVLSYNRKPLTASGYSGQYVYQASDEYGAALYVSDGGYTIEGGGELVSAADAKTYVDFLLSRALTSETNYCPPGAMPNYVAADGSIVWGMEVSWDGTPGDHYRTHTGHFFHAQPVALRYGVTQSFDAAWQSWFLGHAAKLTAAYNAMPFNASTGLFTNWDEYPSVTYSWTDIVKHTGDSVACSMLACNAARAMSDCYTMCGDATTAAAWSASADALQEAIQGCYLTDAHGGYLPWTANGGNLDDRFSTDCSALGVAWDILTEAQKDGVSDTFAYHYAADKATGVGGQVFQMRPGARGYFRQSRTSEDTLPGTSVYANNTSGWFQTGASVGRIVTYTPYGQYLNGGYRSEQASWVAAALWHKYPDVAVEFVTNAITDTLADSYAPYENIHSNGTREKRKYMMAAASFAMMPAPGVEVSADIDQASAIDFDLTLPTTPVIDAIDFDLTLPLTGTDGAIDFDLTLPEGYTGGAIDWDFELPFNNAFAPTQRIVVDEYAAFLTAGDAATTLTADDEPARYLEVDV